MEVLDGFSGKMIKLRGFPLAIFDHRRVKQNDEHRIQFLSASLPTCGCPTKSPHTEGQGIAQCYEKKIEGVFDLGLWCLIPEATFVNCDGSNDQCIPSANPNVGIILYEGFHGRIELVTSIC